MNSLDTLNDQQKIIAKDTDGAILVTAGAGSGKTRLLTHRICYLINEKGVNPSNILAITFTNKATNEMKERIQRLVPNSYGITIKTFHSLCAAILRENISNLDGFDRNFSVYDSSDQDKVLKRVLKSLDADEDVCKMAGYHISKAKNQGLNPDEYRNDCKYITNIEKITKVYKTYQEELKKNNALDFDDLLLKTLELFYECPRVLNYYQEKYHYIHVDEFQDTNLVQYKIIRLLADKYKNIFVVGDEDQCIYCWRGANIENIKNFTQDYDTKIYKLEQNYRSTKTIISHANKLIKNNLERIDKTLFTENEDGEDITFYESNSENDEAEYVASQIHSLRSNGVELNNIGVLMRVSALSRLIEEKMLNYNIPYVTSGIFKFFERTVIKDILAYLKMIINPKDNEGILRIINVPKRGIGQSTIDKLIEYANINHSSLVEVVEDFRNIDLSPTIKSKIAEFGDLITDLKNNFESHTLSEFVEYVVDKSGIKGLYNTKDEDDIDARLNIDQLIQSVKTYENMNPNSTLADYLQSVTLETNLENDVDDNNTVLVSTVHASKGLEFDYVFIIGLEEGRFPLSRALDNMDELEEERRLMYVAITRAKKKLYLTRTKSRFMYGSRENQMASRFINEMGIKVNHNTNRFDYYHNYENDYGDSSFEFSHYSKSYNNDYNNYSTYSDYKKANNYYSPNEKLKTDTEALGKLQSLMNTKLNNQKKSFSEYQVGVQVLHTKFGVGTIVKTDEAGGNNYVSVDFGKLGVKTLSLNFAPLQILKK